MKHKLTLLFALFTIVVSAQTEISKQVITLMQQIRLGSAITVDKTKLLASSTAKETSQTLTKYFGDSTINVRYEALSLNSQIALKSKDASLIKKSIQGILNNCVFNNHIHTQIVGLLKKYITSDFSLEELTLLNSILQNQENTIGALTKIYAFAGQSAVVSNINALLSKPNLTKADKKDIKLALVRCNDERLSAKMLETLKQQVVNDNLIYSALPDILYTKNKLLYTYLLNAILSDDKKCSSANNDDTTPIVCAFRLIEQVAPSIVNFPVSVNEKGEIISKDLNKTLTETRAWITANKETFTINTTSY